MEEHVTRPCQAEAGNSRMVALPPLTGKILQAIIFQEWIRFANECYLPDEGQFGVWNWRMVVDFNLPTAWNQGLN